MELGDLEFKAEDLEQSFHAAGREATDCSAIALFVNLILKEKLEKTELIYGVTGRYGQFVMIDKSVIINSPVEQKLTARLVCIEELK